MAIFTIKSCNFRPKIVLIVVLMSRFEELLIQEWQYLYAKNGSLKKVQLEALAHVVKRRSEEKEKKTTKTLATQPRQPR